MGTTTEAMVLHEFNRPLVMETIPVPVLTPGQCLVRMAASGVCGSDVHMWHGLDERLPLPIILGHEGIGYVEDLKGRICDINGSEIREGDLILWNRGVSCGHCYYCTVRNTPSLCPQRWVYGIHRSCRESPYLFGCYARHIILVEGTDIIKVDSNIDPAMLVAASCSGATMAHAFDLVDLMPGDTVVIQGPGPLGLFAVAFSIARGAGQVIVIGGTRGRLDLCKQVGLGVTTTLNRHEVTEPERCQFVLDATDGRGADVVIEAAGSPAAVREGLALIRRGGTYLLPGFGVDTGTNEINCFRDLVSRNINLQGVWVSHTRHTYQAMQLVQNNRERFAAMITHRFRLEEADQALRVAGDRQSMKAVLVAE